MPLEERMLERFTRERQRASKGAVFNLDDEDELTHYGQSLSKLDDFDNVGLGLDDEEDEDGAGQIDSRTVQRSHFGGFEDDEEDEEDYEDPEEDGQMEDFDPVSAPLTCSYSGTRLSFCSRREHPTKRTTKRKRRKKMPH